MVRVDLRQLTGFNIEPSDSSGHPSRPELRPGWGSRSGRQARLRLSTKLLSLGLGLSLLAGCTGATLTAIPISPKARQEMGRDHGIPYYVPRPYLLVTRDVAISDEALTAAGMVPAAEAGPSSVAGRSHPPAAPAPGEGGPTSEALGYDGLSSISPPAPGTVVIPTYKFKVIYLPDLTRQYALQQRGAPFTNTTLKLELEGGWMFKGTEVTSENKLPDLIESTTSGVANILGASMEQVFASLFPIPTGEAGVSSAGGSSQPDLSPRIWLFEIAEAPEGGLAINLEKPFFEWPREAPRPVSRPPVLSGGGADPVKPLPLPAVKPPATPTGGSTAPAIAPPKPVSPFGPGTAAPGAAGGTPTGGGTSSAGGAGTATGGTAGATSSAPAPQPSTAPAGAASSSGTAPAPTPVPAAPPAARFPQ